MTLERLTGTYLLGVEPLIVAEYHGDLVLSTLGVPPEFAARIVENGGGFRMEGGGVPPVVHAPPTREALLAGRDPALEAALRWISAVKAGTVKQ